MEQSLINVIRLLSTNTSEIIPNKIYSAIQIAKFASILIRRVINNFNKMTMIIITGVEIGPNVNILFGGINAAMRYID